MPAIQTPNTYGTISEVARRARLHRSVIVRLLSHQLIEADAVLQIGNSPQPIFRTSADRVAAIHYAATSARTVSPL